MFNREQSDRERLDGLEDLIRANNLDRRPQEEPFEPIPPQTEYEFLVSESD